MMIVSRLRPDRRAVFAGSLAALAAPAIVRAQGAWPQGRNIRIVVPFPPAGATDVLGRLVGEKLGEMWGSRILVENKPGAGGNIGTEQVARAAPDGDTILIVSVGMATNPYLYASLTYDPVRDFEPVSLIAMVPNILIAGKHTRFNSVAELIAFGRANPGKLTYGSSGIGTSVHLSGELFQKLTGVQMAHVPYRGTAMAMQDLVGGRIDLIFDNITAALPQVRAGNVKALGITTARRSAFAAELAPVAETVPGFDVTSWFAFFVPKGTPAAIIDRLSRDTKAAIADPKVKERMDALAAEGVGSTPAELAAFLKSEGDKWGRLITEQGIKAGG
jgi:tripartite-type tricarboxylate transporter receptor subunit TctC